MCLPVMCVYGEVDGVLGWSDRTVRFMFLRGNKTQAASNVLYGDGWDMLALYFPKKKVDGDMRIHRRELLRSWVFDKFCLLFCVVATPYFSFSFQLPWFWVS